MFFSPTLVGKALVCCGALLVLAPVAIAQQLPPAEVEQSSAWMEQFERVGNCTCNCCRKPKKLCRLPGFRGTPYEDPKENGCQCNCKCQRKLHPNFSVYWPRPLASKEKYDPPTSPVPCRPRDRLDCLASVKLSNFKRKETGLNGYNCDPFGKLGESCTRPAAKIERAQTEPFRKFK